ncbi:uncharacterized protein [Miscanthus floridulus]|uniref:uncharacterized protein isoform X5 n=1 Tax=Miscanthus floridulus TaxID=154761 RepID=UPI00345A23CF
MASRSSVHHPDTTEGLVQTLDPCTGRRGCLDTMETMKMSYELLKTITGNFSKDNILGSGTFGVVYKGVLNGKEIAVKILRDMAALDDNAFRNEFQNLARLDHRNIVQLVGYCNESEKQTVERDDGTEVIAEKMHVALCFQYVENGSLHKHISDEYQGLHWHIRYKIIKGICEGLKHLRVGLESPVLHLDLKPENILLDKEMVPKIADFGLSRLIGEERTKQTINSVGTCGYWPPEYVKFQLLSEAFDIFSLGVIITKIMIGNEGYHSFADMLPRKLVKHVHNNWKKRLQETIEPTSLELEAYYCQQVKTCIKMASKCLSEDRKERPSIQEIVCALIEAEIMMQNIPLQIEKKVDRTYVMKYYPYELLRRITDNFSEERLLGEGGFGRVYKGIHEDGREIAVKVLRYFSAFDPEHFQAEVETVARFRHENIIQLAGYCYETEQEILPYKGRLVVADRIHSAICFEYLQNGSIERHILDESDGLDWCTRYKIIKGICNGLRYLHEGLPYPIIHLDLKPSNILLDGNMVPKISDFGLERVFGEDKMRTILGFSPMRYLPPEFVTMQIVSKEFDIYSLGIIILEMMAGISAHSLLHDMTSEEFIKFVLGKWRKRLEATLTGRHLLIVDIYCNQVKKCIEIALECVEADRQRRPSIGHIVNALDETENRIHEAESEWNDEDSRSSYTKNSSNRPYMTRNYSYKLLREITNDFSEDRLIGRGGSGNVYKGVNEDGREIAVKILHFNGFSGVDTEHFQNEVYSMGMIQHENVVRLVGYCDETEKLLVEHHGRVVLADKIHRALCFEYLQNGSLTKHISSDECDGLDWCRLYKILKGICDGLRYLHEELPISPILHLDLKPSHILLDENMVPKISDFTLSRCLQEGHTVVTSSIYGTPGYRPPEFINKGIISVKSDIYSLGVTIIYMLTGRRGYTIEDEIISQEFMEDVFKNWRRRLQESLKGRSLEGYCQQVKKCIEIASQCVEGDRHKRPNIGAIVRMLDETETMIMVHDAGKLLDVHPMELRFPLKPKRFASSLLRLRNKEDHHVAFRLVSKGQKMYHTNLPLLGIVPPKCTCTIALRMSNQQKRPQLDGNEGLLVQSVAVSRQQCLDQASVVREFQSHFNKAQESDDDEVQEQEVALEFVSSPPTEEASSKLTRPEIDVIIFGFLFIAVAKQHVSDKKIYLIRSMTGFHVRLCLDPLG